MNDDVSSMRLAFYDASDGPRIMLFGPISCRVERLTEVFARLGRGEGPFDLQTLPFMKAFGGVKIVASCGGIEGLRRCTPPPLAEFQWCQAPKGWRYLSELLSGLVQNPGPGHQYLTAYPPDDAIVVVSKGEYGDEVLRGS